MFKRVFSLFLATLIFESTLSISALAADSGSSSDYTGAVSVWDKGLYHWAVEQNGSFILGGLPQDLAGVLCESVCGQSEDLLHHTSSVSNEFEKDSKGSYTWATCKYCQERFKVYSSDLKSNYNNQVASMPLSGLSSDGSFLCVSKHSYTCFDTHDGKFYCSHSPELEKYPLKGLDNMRGYSVSESEDFTVSLWAVSSSPVMVEYFRCYFSFNAPIDGYYTRIASESSVYSYARLSPSNPNPPVQTYRLTYSASNSSLYSKGSLISDSVHCRTGDNSLFSFSGYCNPPIYKVTPIASIDTTTGQYAPTTRPTAITGGNYGIVGDNGQITKIEDNSTIINETNNTYYNPATGQTVPITDWSYNYEDRSYTVTTDSGNTSTITYGDENISIVENNVVEGGDTVTNNYTIYYITNNVGGGGDNPENPDSSSSGSTSEPDTPPNPSACAHKYALTKDVAATCTDSGYKIYTCALCGDTYTNETKALGHDWQKVTVPTAPADSGSTPSADASSDAPAPQADETAAVLYRCTRCGVEYWDETGNGPPEKEEGGILGWFKKLFGSIFNGILDVLSSTVGQRACAPRRPEFPGRRDAQALRAKK